MFMLYSCVRKTQESHRLIRCVRKAIIASITLAVESFDPDHLLLQLVKLEIMSNLSAKAYHINLLTIIDVSLFF